MTGRLRRPILWELSGTDERIAISDFADAVRFFHRLIRNAEGLAD